VVLEATKKLKPYKYPSPPPSQQHMAAILLDLHTNALHQRIPQRYECVFVGATIPNAKGGARRKKDRYPSPCQLLAH
jgi:hypothetical protein